MSRYTMTEAMVVDLDLDLDLDPEALTRSGRTPVNRHMTLVTHRPSAGHESR